MISSKAFLHLRPAPAPCQPFPNARRSKEESTRLISDLRSDWGLENVRHSSRANLLALRTMGILKLLLVRNFKEITILTRKIFDMCSVAIQRRRVIMFSPIIAAIRGNFVHGNRILDGSLFQAAVISKVKEER